MEVINKLIYRNCSHCKKKFLDKSKFKKKKYCSNKCNWKSQNIKRKVYLQNYYKKNKDKYIEGAKTPKAKITQLEYRKKHRKLARLKTKKWRKTNYKYMLKRNNKYKKIKRKVDKNFNIRNRLGGRLRSAFKKHLKFGNTISKDEYEINYQAIIEHLKPFPKNISKYHIDHIKPLCSFNFINYDGSINIIEVQKAFVPENHQWLTIKENMEKGGKYGSNK